MITRVYSAIFFIAYINGVSILYKPLKVRSKQKFAEIAVKMKITDFFVLVVKIISADAS